MANVDLKAEKQKNPLSAIRRILKKNSPTNYEILEAQAGVEQILKNCTSQVKLEILRVLHTSPYGIHCQRLKEFLKNKEKEILEALFIETINQNRHSRDTLESLEKIDPLIKDQENKKLFSEISETYAKIRGKFEEFLHEVRNPLSGICTGLELLEEEKDEKAKWQKLILKCIETLKKVTEKNFFTDLEKLETVDYLREYLKKMTKLKASFSLEINRIIPNLEEEITSLVEKENEEEILSSLEKAKQMYKEIAKIVN